MSCGGPCPPEAGCGGFAKSRSLVAEAGDRNRARPPGPLHQTADLAAAWPPYGNPHEVAVSSASIEGQPDDMAPPYVVAPLPVDCSGVRRAGEPARFGEGRAGPSTVGDRWEPRHGQAKPGEDEAALGYTHPSH
jgi:hypothetical protein